MAEEDIVSMIAREMRAEGHHEYDARWERERRFNMQLARSSHAHENTGDAAQQRLRWIESLSDADISRMSSEIVLRAADRVITKTVETIYEVTGLDVFPGHMIDGDGVTSIGVIRRVEVQGRPAFNDAFKEELWTRPQGTQGDLTIKDDLGLLPPEHRKEIHFGVLLEEEEKRPGVI